LRRAYCLLLPVISSRFDPDDRFAMTLPPLFPPKREVVISRIDRKGRASSDGSAEEIFEHAGPALVLSIDSVKLCNIKLFGDS
jgi:hypothetical protein